MLLRILLFITVVALVGGASLAFRYSRWHAEAIDRIENGAKIVETASGPMEVARFGTSGPAILLLHGTPGGYDQGAGLGGPAAESGYRLFAVSRPGYLRTPIELGRTPAEQADAYVSLLDALDVDRAAVVGISGGGPSALEFAARHPDRCWALVDLMGVSRGRLPGEQVPADDLESPVFKYLLGTDFGAWMLSGLIHRSPARMLKAVVPDAAIRERILGDPQKLASFLALVDSSLTLPARRNTGTMNDVEQFRELEIPFEQITVPTLVLHGTADINVPLSMGELVAQSVRDAKFVTFPGADHFMVVSHDEELFGTMFEFLDAVRSGG